MTGSARVRKLNVQLYKTLQNDLHSADATGQRADFLMLIGSVTTLFEACEVFLSIVLAPMDKGTRAFSILFNKVNSRQLRSKIIEEFINDSRPKRVTKRFQRIFAAFKEYDRLGAKRDEIAHATFEQWTNQGETKLLLCPSMHIERKREGGYPKYHYDVPSLQTVVEDMEHLHAELIDIMREQADSNRKRLQRRAAQQNAP